MKIFQLLLILVLGNGLVSAVSTSSAPTEIEKKVMEVEQARIAALDRSDVTALDQIMADDVTYVHASGMVDTKTSYLDAIRSGRLHYISWQPENLRVRVLGNTAVITGKYAVRVADSRVQPAPFNIRILILSVYAWRSGRWQQIAWQSTRDLAK